MISPNLRRSGVVLGRRTPLQLNPMKTPSRSGWNPLLQILGQVLLVCSPYIYPTRSLLVLLSSFFCFPFPILFSSLFCLLSQFEHSNCVDTESVLPFISNGYMQPRPYNFLWLPFASKVSPWQSHKVLVITHLITKSIFPLIVKHFWSKHS